MADRLNSGSSPTIGLADAHAKLMDQLDKEADAYRQSVRELDKWMTTSLLAINGGAMIAVANLDWLSGTVLRTSGQLLVIGLVLAFLAGGATAHIGRKFSILYTELLATWGGHSTEAAVAKAQKNMARHVQMASVLRVASFVAFLAAVYTVSEAIPARPAPSAAIVQQGTP